MSPPPATKKATNTIAQASTGHVHVHQGPRAATILFSPNRVTDRIASQFCKPRTIFTLRSKLAFTNQRQCDPCEALPLMSAYSESDRIAATPRIDAMDQERS